MKWTKLTFYDQFWQNNESGNFPHLDWTNKSKKERMNVFTTNLIWSTL